MQLLPGLQSLFVTQGNTHLPTCVLQRCVKQFASDALIEVIDMSAFVAAQRPFARDDSPELMTPVEAVYPHDALLNDAP